MTLIRWTLADLALSTSYTFAVNPNDMESPHGEQKTDTYGLTTASRPLLFRHPKVPAEWSWGGVIRTQAFYEALSSWFDNSDRLHLLDHLNRTWDVRLTGFDPEPRQSTQKNPMWRYHYTAHATVYGQVS